jgi:hypothetical protein
VPLRGIAGEMRRCKVVADSNHEHNRLLGGPAISGRRIEGDGDA